MRPGATGTPPAATPRLRLGTRCSPGPGAPERETRVTLTLSGWGWLFIFDGKDRKDVEEAARDRKEGRETSGVVA